MCWTHAINMTCLNWSSPQVPRSIRHHPESRRTKRCRCRSPIPLKPRYSYGAGKIISEMMAINYARKGLDRVMIFRPHNVYGPDMGWEHVVPQFILRMKELCAHHEGTIRFPIQGSGQETRAFVYIDDFTDGLMKVIECGEHMQIYHIGTMEEIHDHRRGKGGRRLLWP